MDFDDDQPLWGDLLQEEEDTLFGHDSYQRRDEVPYRDALPSSCTFQPPPSSLPSRYQLPVSHGPSNIVNNSLPVITPSRNQPGRRSYGDTRVNSNVGLTAPDRQDSRSFIPAGQLNRELPVHLKRYESEDFGDDIWKDEDFLQAANKSLQNETLHEDTYLDEPIATADVVKERSEIKNSVVPNKRGKPLVPISRLPLDQRTLFKFPCFNDVQSEVFNDVYNGDENLVVSAPTGSGKTTIFELAFLHNLSYKTPDDSTKPLAIYLAPTKALCNEKARDWQERMGQSLADVTCTEITGDWGNTSTIYNSIRGADIIVTTPEKFDSMTRRPRNMDNMSQRLKLVMIDEVHILRESRGATLEVVISRMKGLGKGIRFVALSATVPNIDDIARWLGPSNLEYGQLSRGVVVGRDLAEGKARKHLTIDDLPMAKVYKFGEEFRPVPLTRETYGIDGGGGNDWALASKLDKELFPILLRHTAGQPVLVFCPTRKSCQATAELIFTLYEEARAKGLKLPWQHAPGVRLELQDKKLTELSTCGIAVHHAGLDYGDRRAIEDGFRDGKLHMIASTSTLAVGVNLPAHTVVIKGVMAWQGPSAGFKEYSDIDIQQMVGRAGRPQYDKSGVVVVMCERAKVRKYQSMLHSQTVLESCLHENLTEYINSEIGQSTITSVSSAQEWLRNSFFYIRIQQNPRYYALSNAKDKPADDSWEEWLDHYVEEALLDLEKDGFIQRSEDDSLVPTETGKIMSSSMISYGTMCSIKDMSPRSTLQDLLEILAGATEFQDLRIRQGESTFLNKLRENHEIRFPLSEAVKNYADKVFLLLQVTFGNIILDDIAKKTELTSPIQTLMAIYNHAPRIAKAIVQFSLNREYGTATRSALELHRVVAGKAWEDSPAIFRQIPTIGPKSIRVLGQNGVTTFEQLLDAESERIQLWLSRGHDFARAIHDQARRMPRFHVSIEEESMDRYGTSSVLNVRINIRPKTKIMATEAKGKRGGFVAQYNLSALFLRQNGTFIGYRRMELKKLKNKDTTFVLPITLNRRCDKVIAVVAVDELAGCATVVEYETNLDDTVYANDVDDDDEGSPPPSQRTLVEPTPEPEEDLLPNGNVRCHHSCRDRQTCQHGCCKSGVPPRKKIKTSKTSGKGNIKTATDRMHEVKEDPKLMTKDVNRVRQQRTVTRSPSPVTGSQPLSVVTPSRRLLLTNEDKPRATNLTRIRGPVIVRRGQSLQGSQTGSRSGTPVDRPEAGPPTKVKARETKETKEPLFVSNSDEEPVFSDEETSATSHYFDKQNSRTVKPKKQAVARQGSVGLARQASMLDVLPEPANTKPKSKPQTTRTSSPSDEFHSIHGIFSSDDGHETVKDSPAPRNVQITKPFPLSDPPQDWYTEEIIQKEDPEEPHVHLPVTKSKFSDDWEFDIDNVFEEVCMKPRARSPSPVQDAPKPFLPVTSEPGGNKRLPPMMIGGFGRLPPKRQRTSTAEPSYLARTQIQEEIADTSKKADFSVTNEYPGRQDATTFTECEQRTQKRAASPEPQNEIDEFDEWYAGNGV